MPVDEAAHVLARDEDRCRVLTLNRPGTRNAISMPMRLELAVQLDSAMADPAVRVLVITGAGPVFSSGGDISTMQRMPAELAAARADAAQRVIRAIWAGDKPVLAAVEGGAYGAGVSLAIACDRVIASREATFGMSFDRVGLAGDMGLFASLPRRVGPARARQMLLLPSSVPATEALDLGLVDAVSEPGKAVADALADAERIAAGPLLAQRAVKRLLRRWTADPLEMLGLEAEEQVRLFDTDDFAEGVRAFTERRRPHFEGR